MIQRTNDERRSGGKGDRGEDRVPLDRAQPVTLTVHNPNGDVIVRASDRDDALIRHVKHGRPGTPSYDDAELIIDADGNQIAVRPELPGISGWSSGGLSINVGNLNPFKRGTAWAEADAGAVFAEAGKAFAQAGKVVVGSLRGDVRYDLEIELPRGAPSTRLEVRTGSGDVAVKEIGGTISLTTASGDARVVGARGEIRVQTASGDLLIEGAAGELTARTANGDARIAGSSFDAFDVKTVSGDLLLEAALTGEASSLAHSVSGDVRLRLSPPSSGAEPNLTLTLKTVSGDVTAAPPFRKIDRRTWQAGTGAAGPRVSVNSVSGDLDARLVSLPSAATLSDRSLPPAPRAPSPPSGPPAAPQPPPPAEPGAALADAEGGADRPDRANDEATRLAVLEAVERGEIDVDEALRRLDVEPDVEVDAER